MNGYGLCGRLEGDTNEQKKSSVGMWRAMTMVTSRIIAKVEERRKAVRARFIE
jgi:hypothetical protein